MPARPPLYELPTNTPDSIALGNTMFSAATLRAYLAGQALNGLMADPGCATGKAIPLAIEAADGVLVLLTIPAAVPMPPAPPAATTATVTTPSALSPLTVK